jgi:hypothetical protein
LKKAREEARDEAVDGCLAKKDALKAKFDKEDKETLTRI